MAKPSDKDKAADEAAVTDESEGGSGTVGAAAEKLTLIELALRGGAMLARKALGKRLAQKYAPRQVSEILEGRGFGKTVANAAMARLRIPSVPRALLVGGVLLANALVQRRRKRRKTPPDSPVT